MSSGQPLRGIYPILYAFFKKNGGLDQEAMLCQIQACLKAGAHGLSILGLATEVSKLSETERMQVLEWTAEGIAGRIPLAVTVYGHSVEHQISFAKQAEAKGTDWLILQPPLLKGFSELDWLEFFGRVMDSTGLPVAIQNAPEYLGVGISEAGLQSLQERHSNFIALKSETTAVKIAEVIYATKGKLAVFNGRGGLELPDCLRAGCTGMIPAPECADRQIQIYDLMKKGNPESIREAETLYREILPGIVFTMQSVDQFLCYGKRILATRLGLEVFDRQPALLPTNFGLERVASYSEMLGPWPETSI